MNMVGNWEIFGLREPQRYLLYARAYLSASESVCRTMRSAASENTWPNAAVAMMLAAHSVELFLKGAIASRDAQARVNNTHGIDKLAELYFSLFPEPDFKFDVPFQTDYAGLSQSEIDQIKKTEPTPSVLYRYPVEAQGIEWHGVYSFEVDVFLKLLSELNDVFVRVGKRI